MTARSLMRLELSGALFIAALGSVLHFAFGWSGGWRPLALFAAVNESIWEHLKLAFWPGLLWAASLPRLTGLAPRKVLATKGLSLLLTSVLIVAIFTTYTRILGDNLLALDIGTFVGAIFAAQIVSARMLLRPLSGWLLWLGLGLLALQLGAFSLFTFFPPDHWLFIQESTGSRGIANAGGS